MIEIMRFRLRPDADEESFRTLEARVQTELVYQQPGLLRRTVAKSADGEWIVIEIWLTEGHAGAFAADREGAPLYTRYLSHIDSSTVWTNRYSTFD